LREEKCRSQSEYLSNRNTDRFFKKEGSLNENGIDKKTGRVLIEAGTFRPAEADLLPGNSSKARKKSGWKLEYDLNSLVKEMVKSDLEPAEKEKTLRDNCYQVCKRG